MIDEAQNILTIFNVLATAGNVILGITNIYLFFQNRKERRSRLDRDISIKESEMEVLRQRHQQEREELEASHEGEVRVGESISVDARTENDRRRFDRLWQRQRNEEERLFAELGHLDEVRDGKSSLLLGESKTKKLWNKILRIFKRL